jgi:hypothetical protein
VPAVACIVLDFVMAAMGRDDGAFAYQGVRFRSRATRKLAGGWES